MRLRVSQKFHVYDSHTAGNSTRLLIEGVPELRGRNMVEKKNYFKKNFDYIRTTLMQEPRGNSGILAIIVPPSRPEADYGMVFCDYRGYVDMCIHGTIGVATTLIECGLVPKNALKKKNGAIDFDTPAGLVHTKANLSSSKTVESVAVSNVPCYLVKETTVNLSGKKIPISIAFGGNFYAYVNVRNLGLHVVPRELDTILQTARSLLVELEKFTPQPRERKKKIVGVSFYEDLGKLHARNIMIADNDLFDRSPCGTGTCGRMAVLHANGQLNDGEVFRNESIIGSEFQGLVVNKTKVMGMDAIVPEIRGSAYITGISDLIVSEGDSLGHGYTVKG